MEPTSKSDLMVQVEQLTIERDGWKDAALKALSAEVLLTAAVAEHREARQTDGWGHYKPDADLSLWNVLDKIEAHYRECEDATLRSARVNGADSAPYGGPNNGGSVRESTAKAIRGLVPRIGYGGSE